MPARRYLMTTYIGVLPACGRPVITNVAELQVTSSSCRTNMHDTSIFPEDKVKLPARLETLRLGQVREAVSQQAVCLVPMTALEARGHDQAMGFVEVGAITVNPGEVMHANAEGVIKMPAAVWNNCRKKLCTSEQQSTASIDSGGGPISTPVRSGLG